MFGYNSTKKYFEIEPSDKNREKTQVKVGGESIDVVDYSSHKITDRVHYKKWLQLLEQQQKFQQEQL